MAEIKGKVLLQCQWLVVTLFIVALLGGAEAAMMCNVDTSGLNYCRAAITGDYPPPPSRKCCAVIKKANLPCLCTYKSLLPAAGIDPKNALALPAKCGLRAPRNC